MGVSPIMPATTASYPAPVIRTAGARLAFAETPPPTATTPATSTATTAPKDTQNVSSAAENDTTAGVDNTSQSPPKVPDAMDQLKSALQDPVGGSRSYNVDSDGDVVFFNHHRSIIPRTGNKGVDKLARDITPKVETARSVASEFFKGGLYGMVTGAVAGFMMKATSVFQKETTLLERFRPLAIFTVSFAAAGGVLGALFQTRDKWHDRHTEA